MGFSKTPGVYGVKLTFSEPGNSLTRHKQKWMECFTEHETL